MLRRFLAAAFLTFAAAGPALAQDGEAAPLDGAPVPYDQVTETSDLYAPPPVRPFDPPSDFGLPAEQGDADPMGLRAPLILPVMVEDYRGQYEAAPSSADAAYQQGVASAELRADAMMGRFDGRWRATDAEGRAVLELDLRDPGDLGLVEGAWRDPSAPGAADRTGVIETTVRDGQGGLVATLDSGAVIALRSTLNGLAGQVTHNGRAQPVVLQPAV